MKQRCCEIKELQKNYDFNIHKKLKIITYTQTKVPKYYEEPKRKIFRIKRKKNGLISIKFFDMRTPLETKTFTNNIPIILKAKLKKGIKQTINGKPIHTDQVTSARLNNENVLELTDIFS